MTIRRAIAQGTRAKGARRIPPGRLPWGVVLKALMALLLRVRVRYPERLPTTGAGIIFYNHIHWLDPVLICGRCRRYAVPLTKIEAASWPIVGHLLRWYHVIFITRGEVDRDALRAVWDVLADGDISVISPEGTRSPDGRLQSAKAGLAFIARQEPGAWLMPCAVSGTPRFSWALTKLWRRPVVTLTYGQPFRFRWPENGAERSIQREMTEEAMQQLAACLPDTMRGSYSGPGSTPPRWLEFLSGTADRG